LSFERARITASIRIVFDSRFHLVACVNISKVARIACAQKLPGMNENKCKTLNYPVMIFLANRLKIMNFVSR